MINQEVQNTLSHTEDNIFDNYYLFKKVSLVDKYNFYDYMWMMVEGWITISEALSSVSNKIKNQFFVSKINELKMYISSWDSFSKSMKKIPMIFSPSEIAIVESWETTGDLHTTFSRLSEDLKKVHNLHQKIKWALTYPLIIFIFLFIAIIIVLTYVIPAIMPVFENSWVELPFATIMLIKVSEFIRNYFISLVIGSIILVVWLNFYKNTQKWKLALSNFILNFPIVGNVYRNYILSVFASSLGTLISSGIPIIKSLNLTSKSINNLEYQNLISEISIEVSKWNKITDSMQTADKKWFYFTPDFIQLFSVWERTASLDVVTKKISSQYSIEVDNSLSNLTKWIEPVAILIAWFFVVWFAFAIFWAILKVTETVN
jgi:type IV pilus assembly protein PilC